MEIEKPIKETEVKQPKPRRRFTKEYKLKVLQEYDSAIRKTDVVIAKNYLKEKELDGLNRIVTMYLDYAELQAQ